MRVQLRLTGVGLVLVVALFAAGCSSSATTSAPSVAPASAPPASAPVSAEPAGGAARSAVSIGDFAFSPDTLTAKVGQEITWTNQGRVLHTVTFDSGVDSGPFGAGGTFKHAFDAAGTFAYRCTIHPAMKGTLTVTQ